MNAEIHLARQHIAAQDAEIARLKAELTRMTACADRYRAIVDTLAPDGVEITLPITHASREYQTTQDMMLIVIERLCQKHDLEIKDMLRDMAVTMENQERRERDLDAGHERAQFRRYG